MILAIVAIELLQEILALVGHEASRSVQLLHLLDVNLKLYLSRDLRGQEKKLPDSCVNHYLAKIMVPACVLLLSGPVHE